MLNTKQQVLHFNLETSHYKSTFRGTGKKGQLAVSSKEVAIKYLRQLESFGIEAAVIISAPDSREDHNSTDESETPVVQQFWKAMLAKYGNEKNYVDSIVGAFKHSDWPEIIIVVHKLLTGFDAPRNSVLYIDKHLEEHNILQAIARVNRLGLTVYFVYTSYELYSLRCTFIC